MKNIYDITKGQLAVLWAFAVFFALFTSESYDSVLQSIAVAVFFGVIFFSLGWWNNHKNN